MSAQSDHACLQAHARVRCTGVDSARAACDLRLVTHFSHDGNPYAYRSNAMTIDRPGWQTLNSCQITPEMRNAHDPLRIYLRYEGDDTIYVEGMEMDLLERTD
jgi:hypothetical protein